MNTHDLVLVMSGAIFLGYVVVGVFFWRFWTQTRDSLLALFALSFWLLAIERVLLIAQVSSIERSPYVYVIRLAAFVLIIVAILLKNRATAKRDR